MNRFIEFNIFCLLGFLTFTFCFVFPGVLLPSVSPIYPANSMFPEQFHGFGKLEYKLLSTDETIGALSVIKSDSEESVETVNLVVHNFLNESVGAESHVLKKAAKTGWVYKEESLLPDGGSKSFLFKHKYIPYLELKVTLMRPGIVIKKTGPIFSNELGSVYYDYYLEPVRHFLMTKNKSTQAFAQAGIGSS